MRTETPHHKRNWGARSLSTRAQLRLGIVGVAASIISLVLTFGETAPPSSSAAPPPVTDQLIEGHVTPIRPPSVLEEPSASDPTGSAPRSSQKTKTAPSSGGTAPPPPSPAPSIPPPSAEAEEVKPLRVWSPLGTYEEGELVTYRGSTYRSLQGYVGEGDPDWIYADSLWVRL